MDMKIFSKKLWKVSIKPKGLYTIKDIYIIRERGGKNITKKRGDNMIYKSRCYDCKHFKGTENPCEHYKKGTAYFDADHKIEVCDNRAVEHGETIVITTVEIKPYKKPEPKIRVLHPEQFIEAKEYGLYPIKKGDSLCRYCVNRNTFNGSRNDFKGFGCAKSPYVVVTAIKGDKQLCSCKEFEDEFSGIKPLNLL